MIRGPIVDLELILPVTVSSPKNMDARWKSRTQSFVRNDTLTQDLDPEHNSNRQCAHYDIAHNVLFNKEWFYEADAVHCLTVCFTLIMKQVQYVDQDNYHTMMFSWLNCDPRTPPCSREQNCDPEHCQDCCTCSHHDTRTKDTTRIQFYITG